MELKEIKERFKAVPQMKVADLLDEVNRSQEDNFSVHTELIKISLLEDLDRYDRGLEILQQLLGTNMSQLENFVYNTQMAHILFRLEQINETNDYIIKATEIHDKLKTLEEHICSYECALFFHVKGLLSWSSASYYDAVEFYRRSERIRRTIGDIRGLSHSLNNIGIIYFTIGKTETALANHLESVELAESIENFKIIGMNLANLALISSRKGNWKEVQATSQRLIDYHNQSYVPDKMAGFGYRNLGIAQFNSGDTENALKNLELSLISFKSARYTIGMIITLWHIIRILLQTDQEENAEDYLDQLQELKNVTSDPIAEQAYLLSSALKLKVEHRVRNKIEAERIFEKIVKLPVLHLDFTIFAILNYCELLIYELKMSHDTEIINELEKAIIRLSKIASDQQSSTIQIDVELLFSKFALITLDIPKAQHHLFAARRLAEEAKNQRLILTVADQLDKLLIKIDEWNRLSEQKNNPGQLSYSIEMSNVDDLFAHLYYQHTFSVSKPNKEKPIMFLIMNEGGAPIIVRRYENDLLEQEMLFGNIISAIHSLTIEVFNTSYEVQTISHGPYTILVVYYGGLFFAYIFQGSTYYSIQKLYGCIDQIEKDELVYNELRESYFQVMKNSTKVVNKVDKVLMA